MYAAEGWNSADARFFLVLCEMSMHPEGSRGVRDVEVVARVLGDGRGPFTEAEMGRAVRRLIGARMVFHQEGRFRLSVVGQELGRRLGRAADRVPAALGLLGALPPLEFVWAVPRGLYPTAARLAAQVPAQRVARPVPTARVVPLVIDLVRCDRDAAVAVPVGAASAGDAVEAPGPFVPAWAGSVLDLAVASPPRTGPEEQPMEDLEPFTVVPGGWAEDDDWEEAEEVPLPRIIRLAVQDEDEQAPDPGRAAPSEG